MPRPKPPALLLLALSLLCAAGHAQATAGAAERLLFQLANQTRTAAGLPPLAWDSALALAARSHAQRMLREPGPLEHQYPAEPGLVTRAARAGAHFSSVSENLGRGNGSAGQIHQLWLRTPIHYRNIVAPENTAVGIAVVEANGWLFAVADFAHRAPVLSFTAIEDLVAQQLQREGLQTAASSLARSTCERRATTAPGARLVVQWDGDATHLPDALLQQLRSARYTSAAVGACPTAEANTGFTAARVAVLLF